MFNDFKSSNIKTLWYSNVKEELIVQYHNGSQYRYNNVTTTEWNELVGAESKGKFINESIKSKPFTRMILND